MNKGLAAFLAFAGGAGAGSFITWVVTKKKYQQKLNEAVKKMRETADQNPPKEEEQTNQNETAEVVEAKPETTAAVSQNQNNISLENDLQKQAAKIAREKPNIINYTKMIKELEYVPQNESKETYYSEYPYLITGDMIPFGEKEDSEGNPYDKVTLMYYEDGVIADTADEIIDDVNDTIGTENLSHFGDFPNKDCIYVRNDRLQIDFEVCMSNLSWEMDVLEMKPYLRD